MLTYKSLHDILASHDRRGLETTEVVTDLTNLGVRSSHLEGERARAAACRIYAVIGPQTRSLGNRRSDQATWLL